MVGLALTVGSVAVTALARSSTPWRYRELFERVGKETGVNENLLHAIGWQESNLNPLAVSAPNTNGTRDYGMMQINQTNFAKLGLTQTSVMDAETNVRAAARLISEIRQRAPAIQDILSIYNAGPRPDGTVKRLISTGGLVNARYVVDTLAKYWFVQLAALDPLQKVKRP